MLIPSLWARNISAGTAKAGWEGQMFRNPGVTWGAAEFKCQSTNCIAMLNARTIINRRDAGLKGSFSSRIL